MAGRHLGQICWNCWNREWICRTCGFFKKNNREIRGVLVAAAAVNYSGGAMECACGWMVEDLICGSLDLDFMRFSGLDLSIMRRHRCQDLRAWTAVGEGCQPLFSLEKSLMLFFYFIAQRTFINFVSFLTYCCERKTSTILHFLTDCWERKSFVFNLLFIHIDLLVATVKIFNGLKILAILEGIIDHLFMYPGSKGSIRGSQNQQLKLLLKKWMQISCYVLTFLLWIFIWTIFLKLAMSKYATGKKWFSPLDLINQDLIK